MQPQKEVTVACEQRPKRPWLRGWQWIVCAVAAVIEQHGRQWPVTRRTPYLCPQCQCSASHVEHFRRSCGLASGCNWPCNSGDTETNYADEKNGARAFHRVWVYHVGELVDHIVASSNRIVTWVRQVETLMRSR